MFCRIRNACYSYKCRSEGRESLLGIFHIVPGNASDSGTGPFMLCYIHMKAGSKVALQFEVSLLVAMVISFTLVFEPVSSKEDICITHPPWWLPVGAFFKIAYNSFFKFSLMCFIICIFIVNFLSVLTWHVTLKITRFIMSASEELFILHQSRQMPPHRFTWWHDRNRSNFWNICSGIRGSGQIPEIT